MRILQLEFSHYQVYKYADLMNLSFQQRSNNWQHLSPKNWVIITSNSNYTPNRTMNTRMKKKYFLFHSQVNIILVSHVTI
jgi:hypothetical protein